MTSFLFDISSNPRAGCPGDSNTGGVQGVWVGDSVEKVIMVASIIFNRKFSRKVTSGEVVDSQGLGTHWREGSWVREARGNSLIGHANI